MNFELSDEQQMLREAARGALGRRDTIAAARAALDGEPLLDIWPVAREAGWTGLLVDEAHGGAGLGVFDGMLVLQECGRRLTGAGLVGHLMATEALRHLDGVDSELLAAAADGSRRAAFAPLRPPDEERGWTAGGRDAPPPRASAGGSVTGALEFVIDLPGSDVIVVGALDDADQPVAVVVDPASPGVVVEPVVRADATRPLGHLTLDGASGIVLGEAPRALARAWYTGQALLGADALGVSEAVLDMAVEYARERHAFGRPIGSFQAIKHQLVEVLRHIDRVRNLCYFAGFAADSVEDELPLAASCARFTGEQAADYATSTCISVHGGIGNTWEHDAPFYWRRSRLSRLLLGGTADAGDRVATEIIALAREGAPAPAAM